MVGHDDERVQQESSLAAVVEDRLLKQLRRGRDLKKAAAFGCHSSDQVGPSFLRRAPHLGSIDEKPVAKAISIGSLHSGA